MPWWQIAHREDFARPILRDGREDIGCAWGTTCARFVLIPSRMDVALVKRVACGNAVQVQPAHVVRWFVCRSRSIGCRDLSV